MSWLCTQLYSTYSRSHIYYGMELMLMLWLAWLLGLDDFLATTWASWVVVFSLLFSPLWFNPHAFCLDQVQVRAPSRL